MKYKYLSILFFAILSFSCEKSEPEIAPYDELSAISYQEKIYTQPIVVDGKIISVQKKDAETFLTAFNKEGSMEWSVDIDNYIFDKNNYENIAYFELTKNIDNQIFLNLYDLIGNHEIVKSVRFNCSGDFINEITDSIHQNTLSNEDFYGLGILPIDNGNVMIISSSADMNSNQTSIQISEYSSDGKFLKDTVYRIQQAFHPYSVYLASKNRLIFTIASGFTVRFVIFSLDDESIYESEEFPTYDIFSFYENSNGDFIFTVSTFDDELKYYGMVIAISEKGEYLWHQVYYTKTSTTLLTSVMEIQDGYIFTGFDLTGQLLTQLDWRTTFDKEKTEAIIMKTDPKGVINENTGWITHITLPANSAGAAVLLNNNENYTFFAGKYDNQIYSSFILKIDKQGKIVKQ